MIDTKLPPEALDLINRLRDDTEKAIAVAETAGVRDAVNWADLHCISVAIATDGRETWFQVTISEASPDAWEFRKFVRDYLKNLGYGDVEVLTEW